MSGSDGDFPAVSPRRWKGEGYEVGYGKPPRSSRFQKGRSGNPKGRPKGSRSAKSLLEQALAAPITISEGGTTKVVEQRMALFKAMVARAIKGDARSAALVVRLMEQLQLTERSKAHEPISLIRRTIVDPRSPEQAQRPGPQEPGR